MEETKNEAKWKKKFALAKEFYLKHHHLNITSRYIIKEKNGEIIYLGWWLSNHRVSYKNGTLSEEKKELLESIGMRWDPLDAEWDENYELAKSYYLEHENLKIPFNYTVKNVIGQIVRLGAWISRQRIKFKEGRLDDEKIKLLEEIGMIWSVRKNRIDNIALCEQYGLDYEKNSHLTKIPNRVLAAKINYLISNNISLVDNNELNPIFSMCDVNMQVVYGISLEELVKQYSNSDKKGGK